MGQNEALQAARVRRKMRIRKKIAGTSERPRLTVFRTTGHIYCQVIDDDKGVTLVAVSTLTPEIRGLDGHKGNSTAAAAVGKLLAEKALAASVTRVVFDRNGFLYHGRVKALADAAREAGLEF